MHCLDYATGHICPGEPYPHRQEICGEGMVVCAVQNDCHQTYERDGQRIDAKRQEILVHKSVPFLDDINADKHKSDASHGHLGIYPRQEHELEREKIKAGADDCKYNLQKFQHGIIYKISGKLFRTQVCRQDNNEV